MNSIKLLREQFKAAHQLQDNTTADLTEESAQFNDTNKALPAGAAFAHSVVSEDIIISTMVAHQDPVFKSADEAGLSEAMPGFDAWEKHETWVKTVKVDLEKFRAYAAKVYKATDDYLASLKEEDLDAELDLGNFGKHILASVLTNFLLLHIANLTGEISAAKGLQGLKGYPF